MWYRRNDGFDKVLVVLCVLVLIGGIELCVEGAIPWWLVPVLAISPILSLAGMRAVALLLLPLFTVLLGIMYGIPVMIADWLVERVRKIFKGRH